MSTDDEADFAAWCKANNLDPADHSPDDGDRQGGARCGQCDWKGLELDVPPVAWAEGEEGTCPSCGAEAVYLEDPDYVD